MNILVKMQSRVSNAYKALVSLGTFAFCFAYASFVFAASPSGVQGAGDTAKSIGGVAASVTDSMGDLAKLVTSGAYVAGFGFAVAAILKFKQHKDNPQQTTIGTPIVMLLVGAGLIFAPAIFGTAGQTLFSSTSSVGGVGGVSSFS